MGHINNKTIQVYCERYYPSHNIEQKSNHGDTRTCYRRQNTQTNVHLINSNDIILCYAIWYNYYFILSGSDWKHTMLNCDKMCYTWYPQQYNNYHLSTLWQYMNNVNAMTVWIWIIWIKWNNFFSQKPAQDNVLFTNQYFRNWWRSTNQTMCTPVETWVWGCQQMPLFQDMRCRKFLGSIQVPNWTCRCVMSGRMLL